MQYTGGSLDDIRGKLEGYEGDGESPSRRQLVLCPLDKSIKKPQPGIDETGKLSHS